MRFIGLTMDQLQGVFDHFNTKRKTSIHLAERGSWKSGPKTGGVKRPWVQGQLKLTSSEHRYHRRKMPQYAGFNGGMPVKVPGRMPFICWHGCRDLFRAVFAKYPRATIRTGRAVYKGREHLERTYQDTDCNIGSQVYPLQFSEACDCKENGSDWIGLGERIRYNLKVKRLMGAQVVNQ